MFIIFVDNRHVHLTLIFCLQYRIAAVDKGKPSRSGQTMVTINVIRDPSQLAFVTSNYIVEIPESLRVDASVRNVVARPGVSFLSLFYNKLFN